jgi:hypothetical protein
MKPLCPHLILPLVFLGTTALADVQNAAESVSANALKACAAIGTPTERLACYDKLAGRAPAPAAVAQSATVTAPAAAPAPPAAGAPPAPPKESFGLYSAEHPAAPKAAAVLTAKIVGLGAGANGHPLVTLDGGQLWELDSADPLLAAGDSVSIKRATLGSFIMTTPSGRTHRAHRLH